MVSRLDTKLSDAVCEQLINSRVTIDAPFSQHGIAQWFRICGNGSVAVVIEYVFGAPSSFGSVGFAFPNPLQTLLFL
jgi:hypothetical protein